MLPVARFLEANDVGGMRAQDLGKIPRRPHTGVLDTIENVISSNPQDHAILSQRTCLGKWLVGADSQICSKYVHADGSFPKS